MCQAVHCRLKGHRFRVGFSCGAGPGGRGVGATSTSAPLVWGALAEWPAHRTAPVVEVEVGGEALSRGPLSGTGVTPPKSASNPEKRVKFLCLGE